jgi:hypothetical protein
LKQAIKNTAKGLLNATVLPLLSYAAQRISKTSVIDELERRTAMECADYVQEEMASALQFIGKKDLLAHALTKIGPGGLVAEFGVWNGSSINHIARIVRSSAVYGFDSFEGLKEDWAGWDQVKGKFDRGGKAPKVESNVRLVKGWFDKSLPPFLVENTEPFSFIHVDSDTYESAKTVLDLVGGRIRVGTVMVFDEYFGYRGWKAGEFKAWQEHTKGHNVAYEYLAFSSQSVSLRVSRI